MQNYSVSRIEINWKILITHTFLYIGVSHFIFSFFKFTFIAAYCFFLFWLIQLWLHRNIYTKKWKRTQHGDNWNTIEKFRRRQLKNNDFMLLLLLLCFFTKYIITDTLNVIFFQSDLVDHLAYVTWNETSK